MNNKVYEDKYLRSKIVDVIALQKVGKFVLASYKDQIPGLLSRYDLGPTQRADYPHDNAVGSSGFLDYDRSSGLYIFSPNPGQKLPKVLEDYKVLQLAEATLDEATRTVVVQADDKVITFPGVEIWNGDYTIVSAINAELTRLETGVVVWRMETIHDPEGDRRLFAKGVTVASNDQVRLTVTGYALSNQFGMAYLNVVGYKTGIESMRATILQDKLIRVSGPNNVNYTLFPQGKYEQVWQAMPEYTSHNSVFIAHKALPGKWTPEDTELLILAFYGCGDPEAEIKRQLAARLNEALEIPIQTEWADALWKAGIENRFIQRIKTGGDCLAGVEVNLQASWNELVQKMLEEEALIVA